MAFEPKEWGEIDPDTADPRQAVRARHLGATMLKIPEGAVLLIRLDETGCVDWFEVAPPEPDYLHVWDVGDRPLRHRDYEA